MAPIDIDHQWKVLIQISGVVEGQTRRIDEASVEMKLEKIGFGGILEREALRENKRWQHVGIEPRR